MYDILVNDNVVAIVVPSVVKLFVKALIDVLDVTMKVEARVHVDAPEETKATSKK